MVQVVLSAHTMSMVVSVIFCIKVFERFSGMGIIYEQAQVWMGIIWLLLVFLLFNDPWGHS